MAQSKKTQNRLANEKSPYLLQHAYNPINWYPWCSEAFEKAKKEDKPVFVSIGYSTCHWCHVMAHESFEDAEIAELLNDNFVSIKVDKEERPDIDSVYMEVCHMLTGGGGWPTSIFMTGDKKPFFAGTYFPKRSRMGMTGFHELLTTVSEVWQNNRDEILNSSNQIVEHLSSVNSGTREDIEENLPQQSVDLFARIYDEENGGFGNAPKFPAAHNILFLLEYYKKYKNTNALLMAENTLIKMYRGGIFDHIGFGFSRYSTDKYFLVPHFEKMLYDNSLLIMAYVKAYQITKKEIYKSIAVKTADYLMREMVSPEGGFYSAQDADSEGVEGKYYVFDYDEILDVLGEEDGKEFCKQYGISQDGNFEGKNIPNLLESADINLEFGDSVKKLYDYRKTRTKLHLDDKILTSWNSLAITAFALMYKVFGDKKYLDCAMNAEKFINNNLCDKNTIYVSYRDGLSNSKGFLEDYAFYALALITLYDVTFEKNYINRAAEICDTIGSNFADNENGGFFISGRDNETLISNPKKTFDNEMPSGNSVMAYNYVRLSNLDNADFSEEAEPQLRFMTSYAKNYPIGHSFYMLSLIEYLNPQTHVVCVLRDKSDIGKINRAMFCDFVILDHETEEYKLLNDKTTFYICKNHTCKPPTNNFEDLYLEN